jgi:hypothetical protein
MHANLFHPVSPPAAALWGLLLSASAALAQDHGFGTLQAVGTTGLPKGASVAVNAEEYTDVNTRLASVIEEALKARGYQVDPNAETVLSFDTEMSAQTDPLSGGGLEEGAPETLPEAPPPDTEMGESLTDEDQALSFGEPTIQLGGAGGGGGGAGYSLTFVLGPQGGVPTWQGSVTAVLDQQGAYEVARSMVPVLVDHIGTSAKAERVPLQ